MNTNTAHASNTNLQTPYNIECITQNAWSKIAPFWPLKNLVATNPLAGFEDLAFEDALKQSQAYFQQKNLPTGMHTVNKETIKWLQAFYDQGQARLCMPNKHLGLLDSIRELLAFDSNVMEKSSKKQKWLKQLHTNPINIIDVCLNQLQIDPDDHEEFLTLMLTTLPGWASHIQYQSNWSETSNSQFNNNNPQLQYLALRLILTYLLWPNAKELVLWHTNTLNKTNADNSLQKLHKSEQSYHRNILKKLRESKTVPLSKNIEAQLVFCIDVRSEPFRKSLEAQGNYETYGFAGFFGVPVSVENTLNKTSHTSCPVLLKPHHHVITKPKKLYSFYSLIYKMHDHIHKVYSALKYTFTTPFNLVEASGVFSGLWMGLKSILPRTAYQLKTSATQQHSAEFYTEPDISNISLSEKVQYASTALKMMDLTKNFAPLVVMCAHGSSTHNNAYATALDCGACGGNHGTPNAQILTSILNDADVRIKLKQININIPHTTHFLAAKHDTTTDEVTVYHHNAPKHLKFNIEKLQKNLNCAKQHNSLWRSLNMNVKTTLNRSSSSTLRRSQDWSQVRPEWGLAKNAAFIIGPRHLTRNINLNGRAFLHSYNWQQDKDSRTLTTILTAPMIVAQWINAQYLFSTLDNVAFGSGSKVTQNIAGKMGIVQGNGSDLMHGLPLQSVFESDTKPYHQPMRLTVVIYSPKEKILQVVQKHNILKTLFGNGWVHLICQEPATNNHFLLNRTLSWKAVN